ncbi:MAG TPA: ABC-three component system protein [Azospirillaceae bacterium]|nr:ABC-three component system protein [Azospirillaceae bacterium]
MTEVFDAGFNALPLGDLDPRSAADARARRPDPGEVAFADLAVLEGNALSLCIVQTDPPSREQIRDDASRPKTVSTIRELLASVDGNKPVLRQSLQGRVPLVLLPEYALGSGDWSEVDGLVRGWDGDLILIAGFGATPGAKIEAWRVPRRETDCRLCEGEEVADEPLYNGGWCWIKEGGNTTCILFLKNYLEPREETQFVDGRGRSTLRIRFKDLLLCPGICADLLCENGDDTFTSRVQRAVETTDKDLRVLVTGSLLQRESWKPHWSAALARLTDGFGAHRDRTLVALANHAFDAPDKDEAKDRWRCLSGVFVARATSPSFHARQEALRTIQEGGLLFAGVVLRHTTPGVVMGRIEWPPYGPTTGRQLWAKGRRRPIAKDGRVLPARESHDPMGHELARLLIRRPPEPDCTAPLAEGLGHLQSCLECQRCFRAEWLASTCLRGVGAEEGHRHPDPDALHTEDCHPGLTHALETLAFLAAAGPDVTWRVQDREHGDLDEPDREHGHLRWNTQNANLLVWSHKGTRTDLKRQLQRWQDTHKPHPPLIVVAKTVSGSVRQERIVPSERGSDVSASPTSTSEITAARGYRKVFTYPLTDVHHAATVKDPDEPLDVFHDLDDLLHQGGES